MKRSCPDPAVAYYHNNHLDYEWSNDNHNNNNNNGITANAGGGGAQQTGAVSMMQMDDDCMFYDCMYWGSNNSVMAESESFIQRKLIEIEKEMDNLLSLSNDTTNAYYIAIEQEMKQKTYYIRSRKFLLAFLRADQFDAKRAAKRLQLFLSYKLDAFGPTKLPHPIQYSDLNDVDKLVLNSGNLTLPGKDCSGHALIFFHRERLRKLGLLNEHFRKNIIRTGIYLGMRAVEDDDYESQRKGYVMIRWTLNSTFSLKDMFLTQVKFYAQAIPMRVVAVHHCCDNPSAKLCVQWIQRLSTHSNHLCRVHGITHGECLSEMSKYGIDVEELPISSTTGQFDTDVHKKLVQRVKDRQQQEQQQQQQHIQQQQQQRQLFSFNNHNIFEANNNTTTNDMDDYDNISMNNMNMKNNNHNYNKANAHYHTHQLNHKLRCNTSSFHNSSNNHNTDGSSRMYTNMININSSDHRHHLSNMMTEDNDNQDPSSSSSLFELDDHNENSQDDISNNFQSLFDLDIIEDPLIENKIDDDAVTSKATELRKATTMRIDDDDDDDNDMTQRTTKKIKTSFSPSSYPAPNHSSFSFATTANNLNKKELSLAATERRIKQQKQQQQKQQQHSLIHKKNSIHNGSNNNAIASTMSRSSSSTSNTAFKAASTTTTTTTSNTIGSTTPNKKVSSTALKTTSKLSTSKSTKSTSSTATSLAEEHLPLKLMEILRFTKYPKSIWWTRNGTSFAIEKETFTNHVLPNEFKGIKFNSFLRRVKRWGFTRFKNTTTSAPTKNSSNNNSNVIEFQHKLFHRDQPQKLKGWVNVTIKDKLPWRLMKALSSCGGTNKAIYWVNDGKAFAINKFEFSASGSVLENDFDGLKFDSFYRLLRKWGFKRLTDHPMSSSNVFVFRHLMFQKDVPLTSDLLAKWACSDNNNSKAKNNNSNNKNNKNTATNTAPPTATTIPLLPPLQTTIKTAITTTTTTTTTTSPNLRAENFPKKLFRILLEAEYDSNRSSGSSIWWLDGGKAFAIEKNQFTNQILRKQYKGIKFESFQRSLNRWGFKQFQMVSSSTSPLLAMSLSQNNVAIFQHSSFQKHSPELLNHWKANHKQ